MPLKNTKKEKKTVSPRKKTTPVKKTTKKKTVPVKKKASLKTKKTVTKKPPKEKIVGKVIHYFGKAKVAVVKLKAPLAVDERIRITGGETDFTQNVKSMEVDKKKIKKAKARQEVGLKVNKKTREGYKVFKVV